MKSLEALVEFRNLLEDDRRKVVILEKYLDLTSGEPNRFYIIVFEEGKGVAGGRVGGFGYRAINRIYYYEYDGINLRKMIETDSYEYTTKIDIPSGIARLPAKIADDEDEVIFGVVDPEAVKTIDLVFKNG